MNRHFHVVFAGGGTGGHVFPGLAVADQIAAARPGTRITFAGGGGGLEKRLVAAAGFPYRAIPCRPAPQGPWQAVRFVIDSIAGVRAAGGWLDRENADVVVGLGGFASVPMARAAVRRHVPLILLEQNALPGRATRFLARSADLICLAIDAARRHLPRSSRALVTGNPLRRGFSAAPLQGTRRPRRLIVLGGSRGARPLNESVPTALYKLGERLCGWEVLHQSGEHDAAATRSCYACLGMKAKVVSFVNDLPQLMATSDLALCRAGGTTLAELAAAAVPAVLVPYPLAADDHQRHNANWFAGRGGGLVVDQEKGRGPFDDRLADAVADLLTNGARRQTMATAAARLARPGAAEAVARQIERFLEPALRRAAA